MQVGFSSRLPLTRSRRATQPIDGSMMAKRTIIQLVSDLSGEEIHNGRTMTFALDGVEYEIDLTDDEIDQFKASLSDYTSKATRTGGRARRASARIDKGQADAMRRWARENGYTVSDRGRVPMEIQKAYNAAV